MMLKMDAQKGAGGSINPTFSTSDYLGGAGTKTFTVSDTKQYIVVATVQYEGYNTPSYVGYLKNGTLTAVSTSADITVTMTNTTTLSAQNLIQTRRQIVILIQLD